LNHRKKNESRARLADCSKSYSKLRAFNNRQKKSFFMVLRKIADMFFKVCFYTWMAKNIWNLAFLIQIQALVYSKISYNSSVTCLFTTSV